MKKYIQTKIISGLAMMSLGIFLPFQTNVQAMFGLHNAAKKSISANASANWAGYAATGSGFTTIQGNWTIPKVKPSTSFGVDATWIGIGGVTSNDLIQGGTEAVNQNGKVQYLAWTEALPAASEPLTLVVHPGDHITAFISEGTVGQWTVNIGDTTTGQSASKEFTYTSSHSSAEWIEEAPSDANGILPLDNFGTVNFSDASTMKNNKQLTAAQSGAQAITLAGDDGTVLARTSALGKSGETFSVTRTGAKVVAAAHRIFGAIATWTHKGHGIQRRSVHD